MPIITFKKGAHHLEINDELKKITLFENETGVLNADFKFDKTDNAAILSQINFIARPEEKHVQRLLTMTNAYLLSTLEPAKLACKLYCFLDDPLNHLFNGSEIFRSTSIDRLMLRENNIKPQQQSALPSGTTISTLDPNQTTENDKQQLLNLLHQTYWAEDATLDYINKALANSVLVVARDSQNTIIGLVRYISNNHIAYISDMVIDAHHRRNNIASCLLYQSLAIIEKNHEFSLLTSAREGDGKAASEKLYGEKFGFIDYDKEHQHTVQFSYIYKKLALTESLSNHSVFKASGKPVESETPIIKNKK